MSGLKNYYREITGKKLSGYTLAEMLVVMSIIIIILLSLPAATKKVFRVEEGSKIHGRYECYWETSGSSKVLKSYRKEGNKILEAEESGSFCKFSPPSNQVYFMIIAVGGGGAGAQGVGTVASSSSKTEGRTLSTSSAALYPDWVKYLANRYSDFPPAEEFYVSKTWDNQVIQYRMSGTAAEPVSVFVPQLPADVNYMAITPGKGGVLVTSGSGGDGGDTTVDFVDTDGNSIEAIYAKGGTGGNSYVNGSTEVMRLGGGYCDFGLTTRTAVKTKDSGFLDIIESEAASWGLTTVINYAAGSGGAGETQCVTNSSSSSVIYKSGEDEDDLVNITEHVDTAMYENLGLEANCDMSGSGDAHECTVSGTECASGVTPSGSKCPAEAGEDGAVVIVW